MRLALVSLPWRSTQHAPLDIGSLSAYVKREEPSYVVDVLPAYLDAAESIGIVAYNALAMLARQEVIGDGFYATMLYPENRPAFKEHFVVWAHGRDGRRQALRIPANS